MKVLSAKSIIIALSVMGVLTSCKKEKPKEEPAETPEQCFNSQYNGTYLGSGITLSSPYTSGTLTISKTSCQSANFSLLTNTSNNINEQVSQLVLNSSGGFNGKLSNGNDITLTLGSTLQVDAIGSFTFNGTRKP